MTKHETVVMADGHRVHVHDAEPTRLGKASSAVVSTRVPVSLRSRVYEQAARLKVTPGAYLRALVTLSADPEKAMTAVAKALGVPPELASPAMIRQALDDLLATLEPAHEPTGENADVPAIPAMRARAMPANLTRDEVAGCKRLGISADEFIRRKRNAVRRQK